MVRWIPLVILGVMSLLGLGIGMEKHGTPKKGLNSVWMDLLSFIITWGLILWSVL